MIRCFLNPVLSRSSPLQACGAVFLSKRLYEDFSGRGSTSIDQLPELDEKTAEMLNKTLTENCQITCLTQEDKERLRASVISHLMRNHIQKLTVSDVIHEAKHFSEVIKHSELANNPGIQHNLNEITKILEETSAKKEKACQ